MVKNFRIIIYTVFFLLMPFIVANGQGCFQRMSFKPGEKLFYDAVYNWGFIWVNAGKVEFSVAEKEYKNKPALYFRAYGTSLKSYDWFFKVRDLFESYLDKATLKPLYFNMQTQEGDFEADNQYYFNHQKKETLIHSENSDRPFQSKTVPIKDCTFDVLSLIYYTRCLDFSKYQENEKIPISVIIDNEVYDLFIRYLGKDEITSRDGKSYKCIKFTAMLVEGTIFKGGEDMVIWATDDINRVPIMVEAKILVGSVKAMLTDAKGTITPLSYTVKN